MKIIGTYILTDNKTKQFYVGSSSDVKKRFKQHYSLLNNNKHHNKLLQKLWWDCDGLVESIFPTNTRDEAYLLEQDIIDRFKDTNLLLNIGLSVDGGDNFSRNPDKEKIIEKMKQSAIERLSRLTLDERRILFSNLGKLGMYGKKHTEETKKLISINRTGKPGPKGQKFNLSLQQRKNRSEKASLRLGNKNGFYNKSHTEETKLKQSLSKKGSIPVNRRKVEYNGIVFESLKSLSIHLNMSIEGTRRRVISSDEKYSNYKYVT